MTYLNNIDMLSKANMIKQFKIKKTLDSFGFDYLLKQEDYEELMNPDKSKDYSIVKTSVGLLKTKNEVK